MNLTPIPKLDELLAEPGKVNNLPAEAIPVLLGNLERLRATLWARLNPVRNELIDAGEIAKRWNIPESWVRDNVRERAADPIPHVKMGHYVRFEWDLPQLHAWFDRRRSTSKKSLVKHNGIGVSITRMERKA